MADSTVTKHALAAALKEAMNEIPFSKIRIEGICKRCNLNRQSFYYHFKDKYELINWIYDTEFMLVANEKSYNTGWDFLSDLCTYFYANKDFYSRAMRIKGQNSFSEHFRVVMLPIIAAYLRPIFSLQEIEKFYIDFFADAYICAIERWIITKDCMHPDEFVELLRSCVKSTADKVSHCTETGN